MRKQTKEIIELVESFEIKSSDNMSATFSGLLRVRCRETMYINAYMHNMNCAIPKEDVDKILAELEDWWTQQKQSSSDANIVKNQEDNTYFNPELIKRIQKQVLENDVYGLALEIAELNRTIHQLKEKINS